MTPAKKGRGDKRLELIMRDALDGLEDLATYMNYQSMPETVEILSIEPVDRPIPDKGIIIHLNQHVNIENNIERSSNIIEYLTLREISRSA